MDAASMNGFSPLQDAVYAESDVDEVTALEEKIQVVEEQLEHYRAKLKDNEELFERRRKPLVQTIEALESEVESLRDARTQKIALLANQIPPPGPPSMAWVDSWQFRTICNLVICLNMVQMLYSDSMPTHMTHLLNHTFLVWYLIELTSKLVYHQCNLFFGPISNVWWSWLDAFVVVSGITELWLCPFLVSADPFSSTSAWPLQYLRVLRLLRLLRVLKLAKVMVSVDVNIVTTKECELFMTVVICLNALAMGLQLDMRWWGWTWVDQLFLLIYAVELFCRVKLLGWRFFTHPGTITWNYLDLCIVCTGVFDQWLIPLIAIIDGPFNSHTADDEESGNSAMKLLRILRLLRALRLVKLLKAIPPLYRLIQGVMTAFESIKWVLALTSLVLYSAAIVFTTLVTKHIIDQSEEGCSENFGSVAASAFSLFKMMNGDTDIASCLTVSVAGKVVFITFMVLSNWTMLAILTSVISDNMVQSSAESVEQEKQRIEELQNQENRVILSNFFLEVDQDGSGTVSEAEWKSVLADDGLRDVLLEASGLRERDVLNLFDCLAEEEEQADGDVKILQYEQLIGALRNHDRSVDHRSILNLMMRIMKMEKLFNYRFDKLVKHLSQIYDLES